MFDVSSPTGAAAKTDAGHMAKSAESGPWQAMNTFSAWRAGDYLHRIVLPLFIAAGGLAKVLFGSPYELPPFILFYARRLLGLAELPTFMLIVATELCIALILLLHRQWTVPLGRAVLVLFISVLTVQKFDSQASCGCFGAASPPVLVMLGIELAMLALSFVLPRLGKQSARGRDDISTRRYVALFGCCAIAIGLAFSSQRLALIGALRADHEMVEIELLQNAVGRKFADLRLAKYLPKLPADFSPSEQHWVLYRQTCQYCHEIFRQKYSVRQPGKEIIAVEIPPAAGTGPPAATTPTDANGDDGQTAVSEDIVCAGCQRVVINPAPGGGDWLIRTPVVIVVRDGVVVSVSSGG